MKRRKFMQAALGAGPAGYLLAKYGAPDALASASSDWISNPRHEQLLQSFQALAYRIVRRYRWISWDQVRACQDLLGARDTATGLVLSSITSYQEDEGGFHLELVFRQAQHFTVVCHEGTATIRETPIDLTRSVTYPRWLHFDYYESEINVT